MARLPPWRLRTVRILLVALLLQPAASFVPMPFTGGLLWASVVSSVAERPHHADGHDEHGTPGSDDGSDHKSHPCQICLTAKLAATAVAARGVSVTPPRLNPAQPIAAPAPLLHVSSWRRAAPPRAPPLSF